MSQQPLHRVSFLPPQHLLLSCALARKTILRMSDSKKPRLACSSLRSWSGCWAPRCSAWRRTRPPPRGSPCLCAAAWGAQNVWPAWGPEGYSAALRVMVAAQGLVAQHEIQPCGRQG